MSYSPSSAQKNASLRRNPRRSRHALHRGVGGLRGAHAGVNAVGRGRRAARRELLLGRFQHLPRAVLVGHSSGDVRQERDLLGRGHERRPAPLPGAASTSLTLLLALPPRADESR
jgi:hypothetical protein